MRAARPTAWLGTENYGASNSDSIREIETKKQTEPTLSSASERKTVQKFL